MLKSRSVSVHVLVSFALAMAATVAAIAVAPAARAADSDIKVNEVSSVAAPTGPGDFIEVVNTGSEAVDISGWSLKDNNDASTAYVFPASTTLAAGQVLAVEGDGAVGGLAFGLGSGDSARVFNAAASLVDSHTWTSHPSTSYSRCPAFGGGFAFVSGTPTKGAANDCTAPSAPDVVVNEVESNGDQVADWVELKNRSASPVNISGWKILDNDPAHVSTPVVVPANTTISAGGYYAIYTEIAQTPGFGLGGNDSVSLYASSGPSEESLVDSTSWPSHAATTWGRCPDGTGTFGATTTSTRGIANACSPIRINEIESEGGTPGDWVELTNISNAPVDISGFVVKDSDDAHAYTIPASTMLASKGYFVIEESTLGFTLDAPDSARLFGTDGTTLIESHAWATHAAQSFGRCKDGVGNFADTKATTKGAVNSCPGLETAPWPGDQNVTTADLSATFIADLSGLTFDPENPDVLWASQNKKGTLFKLVRDGANFVPDTGWPKDPLFPGGTGAPDTEGLTIGPDGFVYLASERDNSASGVSRMSILRYDPAANGATITPTDEWDLTSKIPAAGANLGLEGVAWVPDSYLTENGFTDVSTGQAYAPSSYPKHGSGLYFVAVENTGDLHAFALDSSGGTSHLIATIDSGFPQLADVSFDAEKGRVWAVTDDTHDGKTSLLKITDGAFVVDVAYDRPAGMPNLNNEGLALAPQSECAAGKKQVVWSDDGDTDTHSLRAGTINCTELQDLTTTVPTITGTAAVGSTLTANVEAWGPAPVALTYQWLADGTAIDGATNTTFALTSAQAGTVITVEVTGTKSGHETATTTSAATSVVTGGVLTTVKPTITGEAKVGETLTANTEGWGPAPVEFTYQWFLNGVAKSGATAKTFVVQPGQIGKTIKVQVVGSKAGFATVSKTSLSTAAVVPGTLTTTKPTIDGAAEVGNTLTAVAGEWGPEPVALTYQWYVNGVAKPGATAETFLVKAGQVGKTIHVQVKGKKLGYTTVKRNSAKTATVVP